MSVKLYEINGEWKPFEYWHDYYGYTKYDTFTVSYKTTANWGTVYSDSGYMDMNESLDIFDFTFFVPGVIGWHNLDDLALAGYYPSSATDLTVYNAGGSSNAASIEDEGSYYYLVEQDISQGWMSQDEFAARGWSTEPLTKRIYFIINESTGEVVYSADEGEDSLTLVCETIASSFIPDSGMVAIHNYAEPTIEFWLGADGRASTDNTTLQSNNKQYLRGEDGQITTDADIVDTYDQAPALSFVKVDGNTFDAASGDYAFKNERYPGSGYDLSLYTVSTGAARSAWAVLLKKDTPDVLTLWAKISDGSGKLYRQTKVVSSTTTITAAYLYELYTDEALTQRFVMDAAKIYDLGSFKNQLFVANAIQNVSQMPSSTTSSNATRADLLVEQNGASYLWCVTNLSYSSSYDSVPSNKYKILCKQSLRVFTVSFVNTQLPGITITMPNDETGTYGTTVTLPTMSGEYESGGKTWTPSAWDIGAFGSTYTINGDVVAHLIFDEVVAPFDSATGTISGLTLPTAHSGSYTNVTFDSLRYYVKGTAKWLGTSTATLFGVSGYVWYHGTIEWTDPSIGDLSSLIQVNPITSDHLVQQTVFRIIFITSGVTGYRPYDTGDASANYAQITHYSYSNGTHEITFYCAGNNWWGYTDTGRIQFRYLDGETKFNGLDAFDLVLVNNGVLSKATTTDRYDMYNSYNGDITIHAEYQSSPSYTEYALYRNTAYNLYLQTGVTNSYSGISSNQSITQMFQDSGLTQPLAYDSTKRYVRGTYNDGVWAEQAVQDVSDMPSSTIGTLEGSTRATIVINEGGYVYLWAISNMTVSGYFISSGGPFYVRVYDN